ncbi:MULTISPECIES: proline--tRNA ligase [Methanobacterium]|uniref:Proline--tRNA ligase n=1 Tax=Methanobacterium bryantii TaxID=2161 RepID=A0A2A2H3W3_METBR|nr:MULTISPECIES: proline--tRNA ligase [Methanobacterium]OEC86767.1 proline--tRNA ligase [Methanobacterium sp. A39]PAV04045.1 proline--tRNA ligase [Methanobacterium bryantii]
MTDFSEWFHNILEEAEIIDDRYPVKGMNVWQPQGFKIRKYTLEILRNILDKTHEEVLFPMLIPEDELAKEAIHVKGFEEEVYWITHGGLTELNKKLALRPTSETAMYPMFSLWVRSHTDLPMRFYQIVNTFRYETKHTRPLIRVREITTFKEAHTVHATEEECEEEVQNAVKIYKQFFDMLGIPYMISKRPQWDKFPGAKYTVAFDTILPDGKALQIGTVHNLDQTFAKTFDITYETEEGDHKYVYQTCYGISDRVIASIIGIHGDEKGLCLPPAVAPYQVVIVPIIFKKGAEEVLEFCRNIEAKLKSAGLRVHFDDRDIRAGKKFYEHEMRGVPLRMEIGPRDIENKNAVVFRRDKLEKDTISIESDDFIDEIKSTLSNITHDMREKAWGSFNKHLRDAETVEEAAREIEKNMGIVTFHWCGNEACGKELEEKVRVDILGVRESKSETYKMPLTEITKEEIDLLQEEGAAARECINCGKPSTCRTMIAKTY